MIVSESQRTEATEEIEDFPAVLVGVMHALGAFDLHLVKTEQLHEVELARIEMVLEGCGDIADRHGFRLFDRDQVWPCDASVERRG
ncbi:hypothetical protein D3C71_1948720 [compost metagenome]